MNKVNNEEERYIRISEDLEKRIVAFCDDELNYHINDSGCADEYDEEIRAQIELLQLLGYGEMAEDYETQYNEWLKEEGKM